MTESPRTRRCVLYLPPARSPGRSPVFGLDPLERTVLAFRSAGVREFVLLGDREARDAAFKRLSQGACGRARVRVRNGASFLTSLDEPVWLALGATYYDRGLVTRFVQETSSERETVVALDRRRRAFEDAPARTQAILHEGGGLRSTGCELMGADGVLVGLALANTSLLRALVSSDQDERAFGRALSRVASREPVEAFDVWEAWQPVGEASDLTRARRKVLMGAVGLGDGIVARHLNRRISRRITERLVSRGVAPWQVSVMSFLGTLAAGLAFAMGHGATGGILAQSAGVLDCVDGELARIRYQDSPFAGVWDALLDRVGDAALIGGMTLYAWLMGAGHSAVALGFAAVAGSSLSMLVKEKYGTQFQRPYQMEREGRWHWLLLGRDGRLFLALVAGVTGHVEAVLAYLALGTHIHAGVRIYRIRTELARA